ncbi:MAG: hypothetical protein U0232_15720 [Thermomicrobiales bacterium]
MATATETQTNSPLFIRLTPLIAALLAAIAALVAATLRSYPLPLDVAAVFIIIGLAATWIARRTPLIGTLFILILAIIVLAIVYGT